MINSKNILAKYTLSISLFILFLFFLIPSKIINFYELRNLVINSFIIASLFIFFVSIIIKKKFDKNDTLVSIILLILLTTIFFLYSNKTLDFKDYKFLILILLIFAYSSLRHIFNYERTVKFFFLILNFYIALIFLNDLFLKELTYNENRFQRYDFTGSVTTHSINCLIFLYLSYFYLNKIENKIIKLVILINSMLAIYMLFLVAGRQFIIILFLYYFFLIILSKKNKLKNILNFLLFILVGLFLFWLFTKYINNLLYLRLFENPNDYSSGRINAIIFWYENFKQYGPLGIGYISNNTEIFKIDWPHNEIFRFYVEGGILGLIFISILLFYWLKILINNYKYKNHDFYFYLSIFLFSIMVTQIFFDNIIDAIYRIFVFNFIFYLISTKNN